MGSLEDLWDKRGQWGVTSASGIASWLSNNGQHGSPSKYMKVASKLAAPFEIEGEIQTTFQLGELQDLKGEIQDLDVATVRPGFLRRVDNKIREAQRREEITEIDWEDIKKSQFARSIRKGRVTKSFADFYGFIDENGNIMPEAQEVVDRLQAQAELEEG